MPKSVNDRIQDLLYEMTNERDSIQVQVRELNERLADLNTAITGIEKVFRTKPKTIVFRSPKKNKTFELLAQWARERHGKIYVDAFAQEMAEMSLFRDKRAANSAATSFISQHPELFEKLEPGMYKFRDKEDYADHDDSRSSRENETDIINQE